jgi:ribonuclease HI
LYVDGASRGNPGPAGVGIALYHKNKLVIRRGYFIGTRTNNQAEYMALIIGLLILQHKLGPTEKNRLPIHVMADSQLLIRQLKGEYSVRNPELRVLHSALQKLLENFTPHLLHIVREENTVADELANQGIDLNKIPPTTLMKLLAHYNIERFCT